MDVRRGSCSWFCSLGSIPWASGLEGGGDMAQQLSQGYFARHWRGEQSLAQSYWVNSVLGSIAVRLIVALADTSSELVIVLLFGLAPALLFPVWQMVGVWRSASRTSASTGRWLWPVLAKATVVLGGVMFALVVVGLLAALGRALA